MTRRGARSGDGSHACRTVGVLNDIPAAGGSPIRRAS